MRTGEELWNKFHEGCRPFCKSVTTALLRRAAVSVNNVHRYFPDGDIKSWERDRLTEFLCAIASWKHVKEGFAKMSIMTRDEIRGKLYELNTHDIRWVLRQRHNADAITGLTGTVIASMQHNVAFKHLTESSSDDVLEHWLIKLEEHKKAKLDDKLDDIAEIDNTEPTKSPEPAPPPKRAEPKSKADLLQALLEDGMTEERVNELIGKAILAFGSAHGETHQQLVSDLLEKLEIHKHAVAQVTDLKVRHAQESVAKELKELTELVKAHQTTHLVITFPDASTFEADTVHQSFPKLVKYLSLKRNVFLTGPAGSGKSTAAEKAAEALKLNFDFISVCSQSTKTDFFGYMDAAGTYRATAFRRIYENGGVFLIDEIDAGSPNVLAVLNQALSGSSCSFPDKVVPKHTEFRCVAAGNTWGTGKTIQYVGRNAIDAATLNRFVKVEWGYDEAFETRIAGMPDWSKYVQQVRAEIKRRGINFMVTPRASIDGAIMLKGGVDIKDVLDDVLFAGLDPEVRTQLPKAPVISI